MQLSEAITTGSVQTNHPPRQIEVLLAVLASIVIRLLQSDKQSREDQKGQS